MVFFSHTSTQYLSEVNVCKNCALLNQAYTINRKITVDLERVRNVKWIFKILSIS